MSVYRYDNQTYINMRGKKFFAKLHPPINFVFCHNARDFIVEEIPLYPFIGKGEHRILKIRKRNLSTFRLVRNLSKALNLREQDIGYAGLKDKQALTYQYISVPNTAFLQYGERINDIENVKVLESTLHQNKLKIGHLKGNKFIIRLKKVNAFDFNRLKEEFTRACNKGFPNFFGYQRFGNFGDNYTQACLIKKDMKKQTPYEKLITSSLQSYYFNLWLQERIKISSSITSFDIKDATQALALHNITLDTNTLSMLKDSNLDFMPLPGDLCMHYPFGKLFYFSSPMGIAIKDSTFHSSYMAKDLERLKEKHVSITGLLSGFGCGNLDSQAKVNTLIAKEEALKVEARFCHEIQAQGSRRNAWVYPSDASIEYIEKDAHALLKFSLLSGCYATSLLEYIKNDVL